MTFQNDGQPLSMTFQNGDQPLSMTFKKLWRTFKHDLPKDRAVFATGRAVPSICLELPLTLSDSHLGTLYDWHHHIRVCAAQSPLTSDKSWDVVTYDACPNHRQGLNRQLRQIPETLKHTTSKVKIYVHWRPSTNSICWVTILPSSDL